ncbi:helicase-exonuclease AddAB subunit AddA [Clostridium oceanicum]|uniref:ATP-dependent helicase/nuclease subunit A n=1 Tax=Clostridium oceanicum TaxID=1543 RepID=A0ABP3UNV6_9CLOT
MGDTKWTKEQNEAIHTDNCNLLVAAGAGAGKTAVLVERIIDKILKKEEPVDIDKLLIVTFTNAAASEMRERIGDAVSKKLELNPESKVLRRQLTLLNKANIMTIHGFCLQVIRNNFHKINVDPNFRIIDQTEEVLMKQEAIEDTFDELYEEEQKGFLEFVDSYAGRSDINLQNLVLQLYRFVKSSPTPNEWLLNSSETFNVEEDFQFDKSIFAKMVMDSLKIQLEGFKNILKTAIENILSASGIDYYYEPFKNDLNFIEELLKLENFKEFRNKILDFKFEKLPTKRNKDADKQIKKRVKTERDNIKKKFTEIKNNIISYDNKSIINQFKTVYPSMKILSSIVILFDEKYDEKKKERDVIDFNDIEHLALEILTDKDSENKIIPSDVANLYREKFEEVLIDEYQDSNLVQEVIMNMVSRVNCYFKLEKGELVYFENKIDFSKPQRNIDIPNRFMVGDVKQSIYKFRQAKPEIFLEKYHNYRDSKESKNRRIKLFKNFRSRKEVIDGVNFIFKEIMSKNIGELDYTEDEELKVGASYGEEIKGEAIDICLMDKSEKLENKNSFDDENEVLDNIQLEGRMASKKIKELLNREVPFKVFDKRLDAYRNIEYKDIVILLRTTSNWAPTFMEELNEEGIPVFADTNSGYFESSEIKTIVSLLQIIDNPIQDIPLLSVMRSPIASFSDEELIDIRMINKNIPFYECMKLIYIYVNNEEIHGYYSIYEKEDLDKLIKNISYETKEKVIRFIDRLNLFKDKSLSMNIDEFIWYLYIDTGYYGYVGALPGGEQRQANLKILFERAKQYEKTSYKGLFNFINFINKLKLTSGDMGSAKIIGENENVVRIMSIHKSKGLEFPVVILSGTGKNFNMTDTSGNIIFHRDLGYGPDYVNTDRRISYPTIMKNIIKNKMKIETLSEEMRILYVALTRAKEKLIITGMTGNIEKKVENWCLSALEGEKVQEHIILNSKSYLDWIGAAVFKHKDSVKIREVLESPIELSPFIDDDSKWNIEICNKDALLNKIEKEESEDIIDKIKSSMVNSKESIYKKDIYEKLSYEYKYKDISKIPAKITVSEIKKQFQTISEEDSSTPFRIDSLKKPKFLEDTSKITAAERGTIIHLVMQHLDLNKVDSYENIKNQIDEFIKKEFITIKQSEIISVRKIFNFFKSDLGKRILKSNKVKREVPFYIEVSSDEIYDQLKDSIHAKEGVILQGTIDCYFYENGNVVLLDYKTDYVDDLEKIKNRYKVQIKYYEKALKKLTGCKVIEKYLYLFHTEAAIEIY